LVICLPHLIQPIDAAIIDGPVMTESINDVSGSDIFKTTIGLTNISKTTGLVEVCVTSSESGDEICHLFDAQEEFSEDFGNTTCLTCIVTVGTFVFPTDSVPVMSEVKACAMKLEALLSVCNHTVNSQQQIPEDIVLQLK
jgi:hypothetical protein